MASRQVTIPYPILKAGEKFKVRYRELPGGSFSAYQDETNAPFTLTGLTEGAQYEVEIIFVLADATECQAVYIYFSVPEPYECVEDFAAEIVQDSNGLYWLEITYTPPATQPNCGWEVIYQQGATSNTVPYTSLPASGLIRIQVANQSLILSIRAMTCDGQYEQCFVADVQAIPDPPCTPATNVTFNIREVFNPTLNKCEYFLDVTFTQSNPVSNPILLSYAQQAGLVSDQFTGYITVPSGTNVSFTRKLNPVFNASQLCTQYDFSLVDICGNGWVYNYPFCRTICEHPTP